MDAPAQRQEANLNGLGALQMHVLTRQVDEGVVIGEDVHVTVLEVGTDFVRLAVSNADESEYEEFVLAGPSVDPLEGFAVQRRMQMQF